MSKRHELTPDATRPTDHDPDCAIREGIRCYGCDCGLVWRQQIFNLEQRVQELEEKLLLARSSIGTASLEAKVMALESSRERAWSLLKELGVSVMP